MSPALKEINSIGLQVAGKLARLKEGRIFAWKIWTAWQACPAIGEVGERKAVTRVVGTGESRTGPCLERYPSSLHGV